MKIIGLDGCMLTLTMPIYEYHKLVRAIANLDDDDSEEN